MWNTDYDNKICLQMNFSVLKDMSRGWIPSKPSMLIMQASLKRNGIKKKGQEGNRGDFRVCPQWTCWTCLQPFQFSDSFFEESTDISLQTSEDVAKVSELNMLMRYANNLKLGHLNVNSIGGFKLFEIKNMLTNNLLDIFVLSETKIDDTYPDSQYYVKGYKLYRQDRTNFGGGLIIYARCDLLTKRIENIRAAGLESITVEVRTRKNSPRFILSGLYRPPKIAKEIWTLELQRLLEAINRLSDDYTLLGDLNCNILEPNKEPKLGRHLLNLCDVYNLKCLIDTPTRITANSETLIDVILTSKRKKFLRAGAFNPDISDHHLVYATTRAACPKWAPKITI